MGFIEIKGTSKKYVNHQALKNINIQIPPQSIFGLLGPNGAGKTTLIRIIMQIIKADEGEVLFHGEPLNYKHIPLMGYLPEERGLYKKMKVGEQLLYLTRLKGFSNNDAKIKINKWVEKFDIGSWLNKHVEDLSKGMQQKVQFISAVVHEPSLIILDEPFSGIDPLNASMLKDEILQLRKNGSSFIFSTHRMESVEELCSHIALLNKSQKILEGSLKEVKDLYKSNIYVVGHRGELAGESQSFTVIKTEHIEQGILRSEIKMAENESPNKLLAHLISKTEIISFAEKTPSINDIFISKVKGEWQ